MISQKDLGDEFAWDHVSISVRNRCPNWEEVCFVKHLFWGEEETVLQLHVPTSEYVNYHPHTLHLWKPLLFKVPLPPSIMVGPK
jgi:hypothetical protein